MASSIFFFVFLFVSSCLLFPTSDANEDTGSSTTSSPVPSGTIQRELMQQILATIPHNSNDVATAPFLTSTSGKYTGYLVRRATGTEAGGLGSDFCLIQIQDAATGVSVWDSVCAPVSSANTCDLALCDSGLAVLDGSRPVWDTAGGSDTNNSFAASMELEDQGDLRLVDEDGELVWKASDDPRVDQDCGLPASPAQISTPPPFAGGYVYPPLGQKSGGALALPPALAPLAAPTGGDDPSGETDPPQWPAPPPFTGTVAGDVPPSYPSNSPSGETDPPQSLAPPSYPSNSLSGEIDPPLSPAPPPFAGTVAGDAPPSYPSISPSGETDPSPSPAPPPFAGTVAGDAPPSNPSNSIGGIGQQQQQQVGFGRQHPVVDNTPYDSGSSRKVASIGIFLAMAGLLIV